MSGQKAPLAADAGPLPHEWVPLAGAQFARASGAVAFQDAEALGAGAQSVAPEGSMVRARGDVKPSKGQLGRDPLRAPGGLGESLGDHSQRGLGVGFGRAARTTLAALGV